MKTATINKWTLYVVGMLLTLSAWTCSLPHEPGPQPSTIVNTGFNPALNVLGILRLDGEPKSSYIYIERAYRYQELDDLGPEEAFILIVSDATVHVQGLGDTTSYVFTYEVDSLRGEVYTDSTFFPVAGETYTLTITHPDFPTLTDTTTVPIQPTLRGDSIGVFGQSIFFGLQTTSDTYMYDVYLLSPEDSIRRRIVNYDGEDGEEPFFFEHSAGPGDTVAVHIYGYDANFKEYLTASIPLKPQTYTETITTVTGGFGVFGSVGVAKFTWPR
ncbi:MAG: DUF4249 family protein [Fidelibacterota bacterium]|nr:MAG: DUF4249 family protein [Candidatus Neomarinimicrobiota bacterium]